MGIGVLLDLYEEEYDPQYPMVCLHADVQPPIPVEPGQSERVDYEYERKVRRRYVASSPRRRENALRSRMAISISAIFKQLPCLGV